MTNWFALINIENIFLLFIGFIIGRFWKLGKKIINQIHKETQKENEKTN